MNSRDAKYLKSYVKTYYLGNFEKIMENVKYPEKREWALLTFENRMLRHIKMNSKEEFHNLLLRETPKGLYHSASYYKNPEEEMELKGRESTDLIFDLDADHMEGIRIKNVYKCKNKDCGALNERETCYICGHDTKPISIIDDIALSDVLKQLKLLIHRLEQYLGIGEDDMKVYFSGHRGFHVHIEKEPYIHLDDIDRISIKDLIVLDGIDIFNVREDNAYLIDLLKKNLDILLQSKDPKLEPVLKKLEIILNDDKGILKKLKAIITHPLERRQLNEYIKRKLGIAVDPAVLTDLSRLIRAPYSLHGKTGLIKNELDISVLDKSYSIIGTAIPSKLLSKVYIELAPKIVWGGEEYGPFYQEEVIIPESLAIYFVNLGLARDISLP